MSDKKHLYPLTYEALKDKMPPKDVKRETAAKHLYPLNYAALKSEKPTYFRFPINIGTIDMPPAKKIGKRVNFETRKNEIVSFCLFIKFLTLGVIGLCGAGFVAGIQYTNETTDRHITQNCERLWPGNFDRQSKCIFEAVYITSPPYTFQGEAPVEIPQGE